MKQFFSVYFSLLLLSSCTSSGGMQTPVSVVDTGTMIPTTVSPASVSLMEKEQKDYTLSLQGGKGNLTIFHGSGSTLSIHFLSESGQTLIAKLETPRDTQANIRFNQIIAPDGTSDGPFGKDISYPLTQSGSYRLIISESLMTGEMWSGSVLLSLDVKKNTSNY